MKRLREFHSLRPLTVSRALVALKFVYSIWFCVNPNWNVFSFSSSFLATSNLTTNEDIKGAYSNKRTNSNFNPFSAGNGILNCNEVLCGPLNPSLIDARGYVTEDYLISVCSSTPVNQAGQNNSAADSAVQGYPVQQQLPQQLPVLQAPSGGSAVAPDVTSSSGQQSSSGVTSSSNSSPSKRQKSAVTNSSTLPDIRLVFYLLLFIQFYLWYYN